ncbi:AraC family transcriptional regulator [Olivibacter sp. SDN3]|uniref:AraC family transcriptional regulator n=1 Tax=Olivibacter sp. SDN3 TaxID=2764720 RepID=UPI00165103CD|nr:AraC family transcriptional regulator [Olivibacter sp. SDN3]QNL51562.1 AraC family transcriptional regulator [Olivibacter sp. SDN3]
MKAVEYRLPKDFDKSFVVFNEKGPFFPCPWHYHPEYEFCLVNKSTGRRMVGDHIGYFGEGDLVFMGPSLPHVWVNDPIYTNGTGIRKADAMVIHFKEDFLGENFFNIPEFEPLKKILQLSGRGLVIQGEAKKQISHIIRKIMQESAVRRLASLLHIFDILCYYREYEPLASPTYMLYKRENSTDRFSKITDYILRNFNKEITLNEVADQANMATTTFCNFFKEHYRMTFVEYLNTIRIGYVCKLLSDDYHLNIVEIAYECGFNNLANFNRQFKKLKGMSPSEYRKTVLLQPA